MKSNELMIGDWVLYTHYKDKSFYKQFGLDDFLKGDYSFYEPIPLTDKILRKNGFEYYHKNFASLSPEHPFAIEMMKWPNENGIGLWKVGGIIKICYVHELQHVLKMAKIDKEITL